MIKSIFVMKANTGELIFYKTYEDLFNVKLTSSFLSAIFSFVKQTLKTSEISEIEVGVFRFIFEIERVGGTEELLFALFSDRTDNLVELRNQLMEIKEQFLEKYDQSLLERFDGEISRYGEFETNIENILEKSKQLVSEDIQKDLIMVFRELHTFSSFVVSSALLTQTGRVIVSYLQPHVLSEIIRLLEGRFITGNYQINELISLEDFGILNLVGIDENFISVVQFKSNCPFETGLIIGKKFSQRLRKLIC